MTALSEAVHVLTEDHKVNPDKTGKTFNLVEEYALLTQLKEAFTANRGTGAGASGPKGLISFNALNLWEHIVSVTNDHWRGFGIRAVARTPLPERIQDWAKTVEKTPDEAAECLAWVTTWNRQIRALDESRADVIGRCPECGEYEIAVDDDGGTIWKAAVTRVESKTYASCAHCLAEWKGLDEVRELARTIRPV